MTRYRVQKAKQQPRFRFYALYDRIYRFDVLLAAWHLVLKNNGAPGVDGVSLRDIDDHRALLQTLQEELRTKSSGHNRSSARTFPSRTDGCDRWVFPRSATASSRWRRCSC